MLSKGIKTPVLSLFHFYFLPKNLFMVIIFSENNFPFFSIFNNIITYSQNKMILAQKTNKNRTFVNHLNYFGKVPATCFYDQYTQQWNKAPSYTKIPYIFWAKILKIIKSAKVLFLLVSLPFVHYNYNSRFHRISMLRRIVREYQ